MSSLKDGKRITLKRARPNPIFQEWLEELYEEAKQKRSKLECKLKEALSSLSKYPLPLMTGAECAILNGFDKQLCTFLDMRLEVHNSLPENSPSSSTSENIIDQDNEVQPSCSKQTRKSFVHYNVQNSPPSSRSVSPSSSLQNSIPIEVTAKRVTCKEAPTSGLSIVESEPLPSCSSETHKDKAKRLSPKKPINTSRNKYKPAHRSGGYALLLALLEEANKSEKRSVSKDAIVEEAQKYCKESFLRHKPESFYTAWSSMARLIAKGLISKCRDRKVKYSLTDQGFTLATDLLKETKNIPSDNDIIFNGASTSSDMTASSDIFENHKNDNVGGQLLQNSDRKKCDIIEMEAGSFDIILLIDKNETGGVSKKNDPTVTEFKKYPNLLHEYRSLKVGDFTWTARHKENKSLELILPYIVERKRMDDLGASIKDGRFHEQKFRLRRCGLHNVIYMVENYGINKHIGLPLQSLRQALANTRVQDGFEVISTNSLSNSVRFLAMMTKRLTVEYQVKKLQGVEDQPNGNLLMSFEYFNKSSVKNKSLTVTETFIKMLLQLKGVSVEKALAITNVYKTPKTLIEAYKQCSSKEGELLLSNLRFGDLNRNVGPAISKSLYQFFTKTVV